MILDQVSIHAPTGESVTVGGFTEASDGVRFGTVLQTVQIDPAPLTPWRSRLLFSTGSLVSPGRAEARSVTVEGFIAGRSDTETNALRRSLAGVCSDHGPAPLELRFAPEGQELVLYGTVEGAVSFRKSGGQLSFSVTFLCGDPVAYQLTTNTATLGGLPGVACSNDGDAEVWPLLEIEVTSGAPTALRVGNATTGAHFEVGGLAVSAGSVLQIATRPGERSVTLNGVSAMSKVTAVSQWPSLRAGSNMLYVAVTAGAGAAVGLAEWRSGWMS